MTKTLFYTVSKIELGGLNGLLEFFISFFFINREIKKILDPPLESPAGSIFQYWCWSGCHLWDAKWCGRRGINRKITHELFKLLNQFVMLLPKLMQNRLQRVFVVLRCKILNFDGIKHQIIRLNQENLVAEGFWIALKSFGLGQRRWPT